MFGYEVRINFLLWTELKWPFTICSARILVQFWVFFNKGRERERRREIFVAQRLRYLNILLYSTKTIANIWKTRINIFKNNNVFSPDTTYTHTENMYAHDLIYERILINLLYIIIVQYVKKKLVLIQINVIFYNICLEKNSKLSK